MDPALEWQMWRQLRGAFKIDRLVFTPVQPELNVGSQYDTMEEALASCQGIRIFLEPTGGNDLSAIPYGDIVLVLGNTGEDNLKQSQPHERFQIATPGDTCLYGINAAAIALAYRYGQ